MKILVLGGTAFLSRAVASEAFARGHDVTCLARGTEQPPPEGVRWVKADRELGAEAYREVLTDWDAVVEVSWRPTQVHDALRALAWNTRHWTCVSSVSVYAETAIPGQREAARLVDPLPPDGPLGVETYAAAKVACEQASAEYIAPRLHVSRPGLIVGAGDTSDRFGYWPARFSRHEADPVLVPDAWTDEVQVIWVRDLARWLVTAAESKVVGPYNAVGNPVPFGDVLELSREAAGHHGELITAPRAWLADMNVSYWAGQDSLPLWLPADHAGFASRDNTAATAAGLDFAPLADLVADTLAYERRLGVKRSRKAGLSPGRELTLLKLWRGR
ncbi:MAG: NAD-dependent epimerase/dehydratase family protein [Propionibacteriaceae bacterium]